MRYFKVLSFTSEDMHRSFHKHYDATHCLCKYETWFLIIMKVVVFENKMLRSKW